MIYWTVIQQTIICPIKYVIPNNHVYVFKQKRCITVHIIYVFICVIYVIPLMSMQYIMVLYTLVLLWYMVYGRIRAADHLHHDGWITLCTLHGTADLLAAKMVDAAGNWVFFFWRYMGKLHGLQMIIDDYRGFILPIILGIQIIQQALTSGKRLHNYGQIRHFFNGKINEQELAIFNSEDVRGFILPIMGIIMIITIPDAPCMEYLPTFGPFLG